MPMKPKVKKHAPILERVLNTENDVEALEERLQSALRRISELERQLHGHDVEEEAFYENEEGCKDGDYEESDDEPREPVGKSKRAWIIKETCPPGVEGTTHYLCDEDENADQWTPDEDDACMFSTKSEAEAALKRLKKTNTTYFKGNRHNQKVVLYTHPLNK